MFRVLFLCFSLISFPSPGLFGILPMRGWSNEVEVPKKCSPCQEVRCPPAPQRCPAGKVKDRCGCCLECANVEGQMCDLPWMKHHFGTCGEDLRCQVKVGHSEEPQCVCPSQGSVCGTDRRTYKNICRLQEAARTKRRTVLNVKHTGPCQEAPVLLSSLQDIIAVIGQTVILGCEVSAQPMADLEWRKEEIKGPLPGDSGHIIVQSRGGPQRHQVTGWLQIHNVRQRDAGLYTCHGRNRFGEVSTSARLSVISPGCSVNTSIDPELCSVSYASFDSAVGWEKKYEKGALLAKVDIEAAFRFYS
ncbi:kazal-type serine protease inhibitor domain-containing protein 1-like [Pyxicephalus adspersus]|uniref:kazal-type serine protease inhibitor domain-containing protein 1-like n=1 Tax=Pyxicephalus adspersus TaxID=30357 RepID=UPI003B59D930